MRRYKLLCFVLSFLAALAFAMVQIEARYAYAQTSLHPTPTSKECPLCWQFTVVPTWTATPACDGCAIQNPYDHDLGTAMPNQRQTPAPPVVRAVMFWMDGCPHCHFVLDEVLPPLQEKYGEQFEIQLIELASAKEVDSLYQTAAAFGVPKEQVGVPFLVIGDRVLTGSEQIPAELPGLIEKHLAAGGVDYPDVPALAGILPATTTEPEICAPSTPCARETTPGPETATPTATVAVVESEPQAPLDRAAPRPDGFALAIGIMAGMVVSLGYTGVRFVQGHQGKEDHRRLNWQEFATPALALLGLGVAGYLAYVETQAVSAICGPVGDCNAVQSSPYARLFGVLPVGVLGAAGYILILAAWTWKRFRSSRLSEYASRAIFGMAFLGTLFSLYLTYLEPFVIKAVCAWCLTSAILITLLLLINVSPALKEIDGSVEE